jgi:hypothetical protein
VTGRSLLVFLLEPAEGAASPGKDFRR